VLIDKKVSRNGKDIQLIDLNSIRNKDVREVGVERLSFQAIWPTGSAVFRKPWMERRSG